jgi:hypothetical protein
VAGVLFHPDPHFTLRDFRTDGVFHIDPRRILVSGLRIGGTAMASLTGTGRALEPFPVSIRMDSVVLRQKTLDASGIHIDMLDGSFEGKTQIAGLRQVHVEGDVAGFDVRKLMRIYNGQSVPWDAAASGPMQLSVMFGDSRTLRVAGRMAVSPAATGAPVHGSIDGNYDAAGETLDLGNSWLALPSTRLDFSGVLGRQLRVHADSRDLDEVLPAFDIQALPVKLQSGEVVFDGSIAGPLDAPRITGHGNATNVVWSGRTFQALSGEIDLSSAGLSVRNGSVRLDALHGQGAGSLGMRDWKVEDASPVSFAGSIRNAGAADLLAIADIKNVPAEGTISADAKIAGTFGAPRIEATLTVVKGARAGEPFDRFSGTLDYSGTTLELANAHLAADGKNVTVQARYQHQAGDFGSGQLSFQVDSNAMPLDRFQLVSKAYPGIGGTAELHGSGAVDITPAKPGQPAFHLIRLNGTLAGRGLRLNDQTVRDGTLTATTKGSELTAHFDSELAGSVIQGDGKWSLTDDYPGSVQLKFDRIDLERLRLWLRGRKPPGGMQIKGSAEGALTIAGPALKPDLVAVRAAPIARWRCTMRRP